jgi:hypothetical protein
LGTGLLSRRSQFQQTNVERIRLDEKASLADVLSRRCSRSPGACRRRHAKGNAFYDRVGYEADDKCAWGTNLAFLFSESTSDGTFAYQMEYSNAVRNCVK